MRHCRFKLWRVDEDQPRCSFHELASSGPCRGTEVTRIAAMMHCFSCYTRYFILLQYKSVAIVLSHNIQVLFPVMFSQVLSNHGSKKGNFKIEALSSAVEYELIRKCQSTELFSAPCVTCEVTDEVLCEIILNL